MKQIEKGTIVSVIKNEYIEFSGGCWSDHFAKVKKFYIACSMPSNNGNFKARTRDGMFSWINEKDVIAVYNAKQ